MNSGSRLKDDKCKWLEIQFALVRTCEKQMRETYNSELKAVSPQENEPHLKYKKQAYIFIRS